MQTYSFAVALRIWHPSIDPTIITESLQMQPVHQAMAGSRRRTSKGQLLDGHWRESYWSADPFKYGEYLSHDMGVEDVLADVCTALAPHRAFLNTLRSEGGRLLVQVSSYSARNYAFELSPDQLEALADLGVGFAHDIYPVAQRL